MKKLISLALTLAILATLTISVSAERVVGNVSGGWTDAQYNANGTLSSEIAITVTANQVESRYAVDVEYTPFSISVQGGALVWNVTTLEYDSVGDEVGNLNVEDSPINIYNYSDKPVYVKPTIDDKQGASDFVTITASTTTEFEVEKARVGAGEVNERRGKGSFNVNVTSSDWAKVADYYSNELSTSQNHSVVIGTINLTIAKNPTSNNG